MSRAPRAASPSWRYDLRRTLGGSFAAHARGLVAREFALLEPGGEEFGRLSLGGSRAELRAGSGGVAFEVSGRVYRIVADGEEIRTARPKERLIDELEISCGYRTYEAQVNLLCNRAVAYYPRG